MSATEGTKHDNGKAPLHLLPWEALEPIARAFEFGAKKYGEYNYRKGMKWSRVFSALCRHSYQWWSGEENDPESGLSHLAHCGACVVMLLVFSKECRQFDDRYKPATPTSTDTTIKIA